MTMKLVPAILAVVIAVSLPLGVQAQDKAAPKPTKAAAQRVVDIIRADKTKSKVYCDMADLGDKIDQAFQKKDEKTVDTTEPIFVLRTTAPGGSRRRTSVEPWLPQVMTIAVTPVVLTSSSSASSA